MIDWLLGLIGFLSFIAGIWYYGLRSRQAILFVADAPAFPLGESGTLPPPLVEPAPDAFPLHYESPYIPPQNPPQGGSVIALPISPYTGQPYDPAWFSETGGGQSNTALLALMQRIEREIEERKASMPKDEPEYAQVQAMYPEERT